MAPDFKYDINARITRFSDQDLLAALRIFVAQAPPGSRGARDFDAWQGRPCCSRIIAQRFGSWRMAFRLIGIDGAKAQNIPAWELVEELERVWRELGRPPGIIELERRGRFSSGPYTRLWGSVRRCCQLVALHHQGRITRDQLLKGEMRRDRRSPIPLRIRWRIIKRDGYRCTACGKTPASDPTAELHVDHIIPVSAGGPSDESNLRTLCSACNLGRGNDRPKEAA